MARVIPNEQTWVGFALSVTSSGSANEVQTVSVGAASAGAFTLSFGGYTTSPIAYNAANSAVQTALEGLASIGSGNVACAGTLATAVTVTFQGTKAAKGWPQLTGAVTTPLTGGALAIATTTQGHPATTLAPTTTDINSAVELTPFLMSLTASSTGNVVPTPNLDTLFETSIVGTSQASFTADFYRDDENDVAWNTLPRGTRGYFLISRFGGHGTNQKPIVNDYLEVWPVDVVSRTATNMANNTVQTMSIVCSVNVEPNENALVSS